MPIFEVTITETRSATFQISADNHLAAELETERHRRAIFLPDRAVELKTISNELPMFAGALQFATPHPFRDQAGFEHLVGDIVRPTDLVPLPLWRSTMPTASAFVLASTTDRVGRVVTSHDVVLRYTDPTDQFPRYPNDALEATGYNCAHHQDVPVFQAVTESCEDIFPPSAEAGKTEPRAMFVVISSTPDVAIYDRHGGILVDKEEEEENDVVGKNYLYLRDLPFFPCVLVNPALRHAPTEVKKEVQAVWEKLSPGWFELTPPTT